jgi:protein TonB
VATSQPQPISTPSPKYPAQALRNGERGTVMVSVEIGADGVPTDVGVAKSSGSRHLDRAAVDAVRRWRFRPAMADGRPTTGRVQVPISFEN